MSEPASLARTLWTANGDWAGRILAHGFVQGLASGRLPVASFRRYVAQDAWFLEAFARAYAFCLAHGKTRQDLADFADLIAGVLGELRLHESYAARWNVTLAGVEPVVATHAYVDFLLAAARRGDLGETIAAMTPCMRLYAWLGQSLAARPVAEPYSEWVGTYAAPAFEALAARLEGLLDRHARDTPSVRANYRRAMELEHDFFDAHRPEAIAAPPVFPSNGRSHHAGRR